MLKRSTFTKGQERDDAVFTFALCETPAVEQDETVGK